MKKTRLEVGDIVIVSSVLGGLMKYSVLEIIGNRAITKFRTFNTKVYAPNMIYEYGKRFNTTTNRYWVEV